MDYPKSLPNAGLVGGKFVDEDTATGTPGSLIPAVWGNSVTDEILNVITGAGLIPNEESHEQLKLAIPVIVRNATVQGISVLTASGNFTVPAGVYWIDVEGWGGGGGGGGSGSGGGTAGGGGAPGYFRKILAVTPGQVIAYTIGSGGNAGGVGGSGTAGGATTFAFGSLVANGGGGGGANPSGSGGAGGTASGGTINITGAAGGSGAASNVQGGAGGQVPGGGGSSVGGAQGVASSGTVPGGAGGGGGTSSAGGAGSRGQINVRW